MEISDRELILRAIKYNTQLRRLYNEHLLLENKLDRLKSRSYLTTQEEIESKLLKLRKLKGVDKMMNMIAQSRGKLSLIKKAA